MNQPAVEIRGLKKSYHPFQLGPLDLTVPRGAIYALIGPNGAGKTTALDLILGLGKNDGGEIRVFGLDHERDGVAIKRRAGYVGPELNFQAWDRVGRAIRFVRGFYPDWDEAYCAELMTAFHLAPGDRIANLSFGAKTKLSLLLALSHRPELLVLDEPTTGLDAVSKQQIFAELLKVVEKGDRTVLISSHGLTDLERFADHLALIKDGRLLLEGRMDEVVERFRLAEFFLADGGALPAREGLTVLKHEGNRWQAVLDRQRGLPDWLHSRGAERITLTPMTLEDLFVALVREKEAAI
jgi:ABC-2 type transport system ATP-binding protein